MIAETIQLALAPVFVLVAIGNIIGTLSSRLGRVVDRSRQLQQRHADTTEAEHDAIVRELRIVDNRIELIGKAMLRLVLAGICIGLTVVMLFTQQFVGLDTHTFAAITFALAIFSLMWALVLFLRETQQAAEALRIPRPYLELDRQL